MSDDRRRRETLDDERARDSRRSDRQHRKRQDSSDSDDRDRRRKRSRSRSIDRPRKRRSLTPEDEQAYQHSRRHQRSRSPTRRKERRRSRSRSADDRSAKRNGHSHRRSPSPQPFNRSSKPLPSQSAAYSSTDPSAPLLDSDYYKDKDGNIQPKEKPNWAPTGRLAAAANTIRTANKSIILKYHEPAEARKPPASAAWRLYVFKDDAITDTLELATQSCWLFGREAAVCDVLLEHTSCSKQHAVLQFRYREERGEFGEIKGRVRLYVLDLESANGTSVNGREVEKARYVEVRDRDVLRFGHSEREYLVQLPPREDRKAG
jgi:smad nuclear-interacting protein 1